MNQDSEILLEIKGKGLRQLVSRILLVLWIVFAINMWDHNPIFFLFSIVASLLLICFTTKDTIVIKRNEFEINYRSWIPLFDSSFQCFYSEIDEISYGQVDLEFKDVLRRILFAGMDISVRKRNSIRIRTIENRIYYFTPKVPEEGFRIAVDFIIEQVSLKVNSKDAMEFSSNAE